MIKKSISEIFKLNDLTSGVIKNLISSMIVRIVGLSAGLIVSVLLGHLIGAEGVGIISLSARIISVLIVLSLFGLPEVIIKKIAIAKNENDFQTIGSVLKTVKIIAGLLSFTFTLILIILSRWISINIFNEPTLVIPLIISAIVMPCQVFSRIFSASLIGYEKIWQGNLVDQSLSIVVTGSLLLITWLAKVDITINLVAFFYAIGRIVVLITVYSYWNTLFQYKWNFKIISNALLKTSMPLLFVSITLILASSIDLIMLGWLSSIDQVGYYTIAFQLAVLTSIFLQIANSVLMPKIATLYSNNNIEKMRIITQKITLILTIIGILSFLFFLLLGKPLLNLWGTEFINAYSILIILSLGQFINVASGPVMNILMMCNSEKILMRITLLSLALNVVFNYFLIRRFDAEGAAVGTFISIATVMTISSYFVWKKLGFVPINLTKR